MGWKRAQVSCGEGQLGRVAQIRPLIQPSLFFPLVIACSVILPLLYISSPPLTLLSLFACSNPVASSVLILSVSEKSQLELLTAHQLGFHHDPPDMSSLCGWAPRSRILLFQFETKKRQIPICTTTTLFTVSAFGNSTPKHKCRGLHIFKMYTKLTPMNSFSKIETQSRVQRKVRDKHETIT